MVAHEDLQGIEVTIRVNGQALNEYDAEKEEVHHENAAVAMHQTRCTVSKYVEVQTGKEFAVKVAVKRPYQFDCPNLSFHVIVDGHTVWKPVVHRRDYRQDRGWEVLVVGPQITTGANALVRPMQFSQLQITEGGYLGANEVIKDAERVSKIGEIIVLVHRKGAGTASFQRRRDPMLGYDNDAVIHEKALKGQAKSHGTRLGPAIPSAFPHYSTYPSLDGDDFPLARFVIRYRSKEALQQLHILPRTPQSSPKPETGSQISEMLDGLDGLDEKDRRELEALAATLMQKKWGKVSRRVQTGPANRGVKRERDADEESLRDRPRKRFIQVNGVIDLTDD